MIDPLSERILKINNNIINKVVIYSNVPLLIEGYIITAIPNVSEFLLESCIKSIIENNDNVVFDTIQYLDKTKEVKFYTNKKIKYKSINNSSEALRGLKKILQYKDNEDNSCISIYEVSKLLKRKNYEYEQLKRYYKYKIERIVHSKIMKGLNIMVDVDDYDYHKNIMYISINIIPYSKKQDICFYKKDNELNVLNIETFSSLEKEIVDIIKDILLELYGEFEEFFDFKKQFKLNVSTSNSNFLVNINYNQIEIISDGIIIKQSVNLLSNNGVESYSSNISKLLDNNEEEIFKKIFIKIEDCPLWMQDELYEIRQRQLNNKTIEESSYRFKGIKSKILSLIMKK